MSAFVVAGALAGLIIGTVDSFDTVVGGFTHNMGVAGTIGFVLVCVAIHVAFGAVTGLLAGGLAAAGRRFGFRLDAGAGLALGRLRFSPLALTGLIGAGFVLVLCGAMWWFLGGLPFGFEAAEFLAVTAAASLSVLAVGLFAARRSRLVFVALWTAVAVGVWYVEARLIYQFSKQGMVPILHTVGLFGLYVFAIVMVVVAAPRLWAMAGRTSRPVTVGLIVTALALLFGARPLLSLGSHQLRLAAHERTSLTYRLLELLPASARGAAEAYREAGCRPAAAAAGDRDPGFAGGESVRGVVLVMIDSLRADRVGPELTPNMAALAEQSASFSRAYSPVPSTYQAMRTMMSGRFSNRDTLDEFDKESLGPLLNARGIKTIAVAAHENLWYAVHMFDVYDQFEEDISNRTSLTSHDSVANAAEHLDALGPDEKFFMVVHFYDPHAHYVGNDMFDFGGSEVARYDAEVAYTDHWVGQLIEDIDRRGMRDDVAVMVVSDHGDEFWEHRYMRHLLRLYDESLRVAMILRFPGSARQRISTPVSVMDVGPTVLDLFGFGPEAFMEGRSLVPAVRGTGVLEDRPLFLRSYYDRAAAIVSGHTKVIWNRNIGANEYYDLDADPGEQRNLADSNPSDYHELYCELVGWMSQTSP